MKKFAWIFTFALLSGLFFYGFLLWSSRPFDFQAQQLKGLQQEVEVFWDKKGVVHLEARSDADAYRALGFLHARDRLFQIDFIRMAVNGRLSEILGEKGLKKDRFFRTIGFAHTVKRQKELRPEYFQGDWYKSYQSCVDGLNEFIQLDRLPLEYKILRRKPELFQVDELLAISGYMAFSFAHGFHIDPLLSKIRKRFNKEVKEEEFREMIFNELASDYSMDSSWIKRATKQTKSPQSKEVLPIHSESDGLSRLASIMEETLGSFAGSNSWLVHGSRTKSGKAILCNDPHISYSNPSVWWEANFATKEHRIHGFFLSGFPFPLLGHNEDFAYGLTMLENDDMDLYLLTTDETGKKYQTSRGWEEFTIRKEEIRLKGGEMETLEVRHSRFGPVVSDLLRIPMKETIALRWTFYEPDNRLYEAFYNISRSKNLKEFEQGVKMIMAPGLNISYANKEGDIAYFAAAALTDFNKKYPSWSLLRGENPDHQFPGYLPFSRNPKLLNPDSGVIITANNPPGSPVQFPGYYQPEDRAMRIEGLLKQRQKWDSEGMMKVLTDRYHYMFTLAKPAFEEISKEKDLSPALKKDLQSILSWDGQHEVDSLGAAFFQEWLLQMAQLLIKPHLEEKEFENYMKHPLWRNWISSLMRSRQSAFLSHSRLDYLQAVKKALENTRAALNQRQGAQETNWVWGNIHTIEYGHMLGSVWPLNHLFNIGPFPAPGARDAIDCIGSRYHPGEKRFQAVYGPSTRRIIDFSDINQRSYSILPTGNSGNVLSVHYDDMAQDYLKGKFHSVVVSKAAVEKLVTAGGKKAVLKP